MHGRAVDADLKVRVQAAPPHLQLAGDLVEHPVADFHDEFAALRHGNEFGRADHAPHRVAPAQQGFGLAHMARGQFHNRLVMQLQLAAVQRVVQVVGDARTLHGCVVQSRGEIAEPVAPGVFGVVERLVRIFVEGLDLAAVVRAEGDADAGRYKHALTPQLKRGGHALQQFL